MKKQTVASSDQGCKSSGRAGPVYLKLSAVTRGRQKNPNSNPSFRKNESQSPLGLGSQCRPLAVTVRPGQVHLKPAWLTISSLCVLKML